MIKAIIFDMYGTLINNSKEVVPNAAEVLTLLKNDYKLALCTSYHRDGAGEIIERFGLADFFEQITCDDDVSRGKPDPEPYVFTADMLGLTIDECLVVEDSESGMHAAKDAGMTVVARKAGHNKHNNFSVADFVIEDLIEVVEIAKNLNS